MIALGADAPLLGPGIVRRAFRALARRDSVLGPARMEGITWSVSGGRSRGSSRASRGALRPSSRRLSGGSKSRGSPASCSRPLGDVDTGPDLDRLREEILERWRHPGAEPFPVRTFRALAWMDSRPSAHAREGRR